MQNDSSKDFDLLVGSMLKDAGIKPSRRVWRAVSSRLDAAEAAQATPVVWLRWAGLGLAATAVAATVFFTGTGRTAIPTSQYNMGQMVAQTIEPTADDVIDSVPVASAVPQEPAASVRNSVKSGHAAMPATTPADNLPAAAQSSEPDASVSQPSPANTDNQAAGTETTGTKPGTQTGKAAAGQRRKESRPSVTSDDWSNLLAEDYGKRGSDLRASLYAQGSLGGNDSDINFRRGTAMMAPGTNGSGISEQSMSTYGVPVSFGLGVRFYVAKKLSLGTGLDYSLLTRTFTGRITDISGSVLHSMHYIGVPVNLYYDVIGTDKVKFYVYGGGEAEFCVSNTYTLFASPNIVRRSPVNRPQFSAGAGLGVEFKLSNRLGLYFDPSVKYYFNCSQPKNIRTDKPFMADFDAGLRFNF